MTKIECGKCGVPHEVDFSKIGASTFCEACRPAWDIKQRSWMARTHKAMVKKRMRIIRDHQRNG